jgi:hypothetical protein
MFVVCAITRAACLQWGLSCQQTFGDLEVINMGMVWINYEQMEQLRECNSEMELPLSRLVAEAVNHWSKFVAPSKLDALRVTLIPVSKEPLDQPLKRINLRKTREQLTFVWPRIEQERGTRDR